MRDPLTLEYRLALDARRFELFQALRLIECAYEDTPRLGTSLRVHDDPVRLGQNAEFAFSGAEIAGYEPAAEDKPSRLAANVGLLGADGPMPLHFTEYVRDRVRHAGDRTWSSFLDMFHHRMLCLLYRASASSEPVVGLDRDDGEGFSRYVGSLCGFGSTALKQRDTIDDDAKLHFCALLAGKTRHAEGLATVLSQYFGVPVAIEQFVGRWIALPESERTHLGTGEPKTLGKGLVLGRRIWDRQHTFRVIIGPLGRADSGRFLPGTRSFVRLVDWVRQYTSDLLEWDVEVRLTSDAVVPMRLGQSACVARNTWLGRTRSAEHTASLRFSPEAACRRSALRRPNSRGH